jgi:hypothetical protein
MSCCDVLEPQAFHREERRAAKPHVCCECHGAIARGEVHEYVSGIWDHTPGSERTCLPCTQARAYVQQWLDEQSDLCNCGLALGQLLSSCDELVRWDSSLFGCEPVDLDEAHVQGRLIGLWYGWRLWDYDLGEQRRAEQRAERRTRVA